MEKESYRTQKRTRILIVDDEKDICYFLGRNLTKRDFEISYAHSLKEANTQLLDQEPRILLLDNHLPDGFGIDFIAKAKIQTPSIKIIMVTAHDTQQDRNKAFSNGADYFLAKPFTINEINKIIDIVLEEA